MSAHRELQTRAPIDYLLACLEGVRATAADRWIARCPAHDDKSPSLNIRAMDDGRLLIHCFAGCPAIDIVAAIGMELSDLFPPQAIQHAKSERLPFSTSDALRCLAFEATFLLLVSRDLADGKPLKDADHTRLLVSTTRIGEAERLCHGR